jgi:hypothetical protein
LIHNFNSKPQYLPVESLIRSATCEVVESFFGYFDDVIGDELAWLELTPTRSHKPKSIQEDINKFIPELMVYV